MDSELEFASPVLRLKTKEGQIENGHVPWRGKGRVFSRETELTKSIAQHPLINAFSRALRKVKEVSNGHLLAYTAGAGLRD